MLVFNGSGIQALKAKLKMLHMRNLVRNIHLWEVHRRLVGKVIRIWGEDSSVGTAEFYCKLTGRKVKVQEYPERAHFSEHI